MSNYSYQKIDKDVEPLDDDILVIDMEQGYQKTSGGIILPDDTSSEKGIRSRWAKVYKIGKNITNVEEDEYILVEHGRWTYAITIEDNDGNNLELQKVDPKDILLAGN